MTIYNVQVDIFNFTLNLNSNNYNNITNHLKRNNMYIFVYI